MKTTKHQVVIKISEAKRRELFEKPITRDDGTVVFLVTGIKEEAGFDKAYSQSVSVGEVILVGSEVKNVHPGDIALLDYTVDTNEQIVVSANREEKVVCIDTRTSYQKKDFILDATRRTPHPTVMHRQGELEKATLLIAVVRKNVIIPLSPYVLLQHVKPPDEFKVSGNGKMFVLEEDEGIVERTVLYSHEGSEFNSGEEVLVEYDSLFQRELNDQKFDVVFEKDIVAVLSKD